MNGPPSDAQAKALEFVNSASSYVLLATIALLAWVASGVEFSNDSLRIAAMACLTLSVVFGVVTLSLKRRQELDGGLEEGAGFADGLAVAV